MSATGQRLASIIKETVKRPADLVEPYGGEEFSVVLHHTHAVGAIRFVEENRTKIRSLKVAPTGSTPSQWIALRLGMATLVPNRQLLTATLIALTHQVLYQVKAVGRNRNTLLQHPDSQNAQASSGNVYRSKGKEANLLRLSMRE